MRKIQKIERFLDNIGPLLLLAIVITWVLGAVQLYRPAKDLFSGKYQSDIPLEQQRQTTKEVTTLSNKFGKEAEAIGNDYRPEEFFAHLKTLKIKASEGGITPGLRAVYTFKKVFDRNYNARRFTHEEVEKERKIFSKWDKGTRPETDSLTLQQFGNWISKLYFRTIMLIIPFYIIIMASRNGILETILAEKKEFVYAILLWPYFFDKYPRNIIREIRVEAELRRIKDLFRKFSPRELTLVRKIANSSDYKQWISQKRNYNRGLTLALMATIMISLLPSVARTQSTTSKTTTTSTTSCEQFEENTEDDTNTVTPAIIEPPILIEQLIMIAVIKVIKLIWKSTKPDEINRVPELSLLCKSETPITIAKGKPNEHDQNFNHINTHFCFN